MQSLLLVITAPHFVAGICMEGDVAVRSAPILKYMLGWDALRIKTYVAKKGWMLEAQ